MKRPKTLHLLSWLIMMLFISFTGYSQSVNVSGPLQKWHKISVSLTLPGNNLSESEATFRNSRMDVIFTSPNGTTIRVPGYFAADGNAANSNAKQGKVFRAFLRPNQTGNWSYRVLYYTGNNVAIAGVNNLPSPVYNLTGSINGIAASNKSAPDLRAKGRLVYKTTGTNNERRYLQFSETGEYYLKLGPDSPENFLNYNDFDADVPGNVNSGFTPEHQFNPHASDFNTGNPTWDGGKGRNIIGALNYLKDQRMNSVSMSLFGGDDKNVYPWINPNAKFVYDVSKLEQWEIVLNHAEQNGLLLHLKLAENENWSALNSNQIKTYYREMIARFGHHLALEWNISEEYRGTPASAIERIDFLAANDPWQNHRVIHTYPDEHGKYATWLNLNAKLTGASIQSSSKSNYASAYNGPDGILTWINNSKNDGTPWVVASDEQNPGSTGIFNTQNINDSSVKTEARTRILWKTLIAGGPGVMWYGGGQGDFKTENFNRFNTLFTWSRYAIIDFFKNNNIEFWKTVNSDNLVSGSANCLAEPGRTYVIYLENGGSTNVNLNGQTGSFSVQWFNPRNGGALLNGNVTQVTGGANRSIGNPPNAANSDWVALVRQNGTDAVTGVNITQASVSITQGQTSNLTAAVIPSSAANRNVTWSSNNTAVATVNSGGVVTGVSQGSATITVRTVDGGFTDTASVSVLAVSNAPCDYEEVNGLVVIEAENINFNGTAWQTKTAKGGFTGAGYLDWLGANSFGVPGNGTITTKIRINSPGKYKFEWRNTVGEGTNTTEANDSWLRFPDASDFYGEKPNGARTYPRGSGKTPNPEGAGSNNWFKVYGNNLNWSWQTTTGDNADGRPIFVEFDAAGVYTMEISGRSKNHLIDRIVLSKSTATNPLALSNPETPCSGNPPPPSGNCNAAPTGLAVASVTNTSVTLSFNNTAGDSRTFELRAFPEGGFNGNINVGGVGFAAAGAGSTSVTISGLQAGTSYDFVFRALCPGSTPGVSPRAPTLVGTTSGGNTSIAVTGVNATPATASVGVGDTSNLTATVAPANATNTSVNWTTSNANVATVNGNGVVTGVASGSATITVTTVDGGFTDTVAITVTTSNPPNTFAIPGTIQVENFAAKNGDVRAENTPGTNGGQNLGFIRNTNYTEYDINVVTTGSYTLSAFTSSNGVGGNIVASIGGTNIGSVTVPVNNQWHNYSAVTTDVQLNAGVQRLRLTYTGPAGFLFNIERAEFTLNNTGSTADCSVPPANLSVSATTNTSATIAFNNTPNDTRVIEVRAFTEGTFNGSLTGAVAFASGNNGVTSVTINGLSTGTTYDFVLRSLCGPGGNGPSTTAVVSGTTSGGTTSQTVTLSAIDDAYIRFGNSINNSILYVEPNNARVSYLKFNVSQVSGNITAANLRLTGSTDAGNGVVQVHQGTSNNWTETNLSSANAPAIGSLLGSKSGPFSNNLNQDFTLNGISLNGNFLTVVVSQTNGGDANFKSSEAANGQPVLAITYNAPLLREKQESTLSLIKTFPNPIKDVLNINGISGRNTVTIKDYSGKTIIRQKSSGSQNVKLDVSRLPVGMYFVEIQSNTEINNFKIIKI